MGRSGVNTKDPNFFAVSKAHGTALKENRKHAPPAVSFSLALTKGTFGGEFLESIGAVVSVNETDVAGLRDNELVNSKEANNKKGKDGAVISVVGGGETITDKDDLTETRTVFIGPVGKTTIKDAGTGREVYSGTTISMSIKAGVGIGYEVSAAINISHASSPNPPQQGNAADNTQVRVFYPGFTPAKKK